MNAGKFKITLFQWVKISGTLLVLRKKKIGLFMKGRLRLLITAMLFISVAVGQQKDTLIKKLDSLHRKTDSIGKQNNNINPSA